MCVAIGGCGDGSGTPNGSSAPRGGAIRFTKTKSIRDASEGVRLARLRLPGGYASWFGEQYRVMGRAYFKLSVHMEESSRHRVVSAGGGSASLSPGEYGIAALGISRGCLGGHEYALAYGMLSDPEDTVVAQAHGVVTRLEKKVLPAHLRANGVLVYSLVPRGSLKIVTSARSGHTVSSEAYTESSEKLCPA